MTDKKKLTWQEFQDEHTLVIWRKRAQQHRLEGCVECLNGGCITAAIKLKED